MTKQTKFVLAITLQVVIIFAIIIFKVAVLTGGTTTINSITSTYEGHHVMLKFNVALTVKDGTGNLKLAGDFVTTNEDTLELVSGGANWFEISRSTN